MAGEQLTTTLQRNSRFVSLAVAEKERVLGLVEAERDDPRRLGLVIAGTVRMDAIDIAAAYLTKLGLNMTVRIISFDVFGLATGERIVVREVDENEHPGPAVEGSSIEAIRQRAATSGTSNGFDALVAMAGKLGLPVKPWPRSVTITGPARGNPTILYLRPDSEGLRVWVSPEKAAHFLGLTSGDLDSLGVPRIIEENVRLRDDEAVELANRFEAVATAARLRLELDVAESGG
jgi:hypothetical protein